MYIYIYIYIFINVSVTIIQTSDSRENLKSLKCHDSSRKSRICMTLSGIKATCMAHLLAWSAFCGSICLTFLWRICNLSFDCPGQRPPPSGFAL